MDDHVVWLDNGKVVRLALLYLGTFSLVTIPALLLMGPVIGAPPLLTSLGYVVIALVATTFFFRTQPWKVGLSSSGLRLEWLVKRVDYRYTEIAQAIFLVETRYLDREWPARLYDLRLRITDGSEKNIGGIAG